MLEIYTDGACSGNPGPGGWATVILDKDNIHIYTGYSEQTTNNIMELSAVSNALSYLLTESIDSDCIIYTDSAYIANCFKDKWYTKWIENGWKTSTKQPVANKELWQEILSKWGNLRSKINIEIKKVQGHANNEYNNLADKFAVKCSKNKIAYTKLCYKKEE